MTRLSLLLLFLALFSNSLRAEPEPDREASGPLAVARQPLFQRAEKNGGQKDENILEKTLHRFGFGSKAAAREGKVPLLGSPGDNRGLTNSKNDVSERKRFNTNGDSGSGNGGHAKANEGFSYNENDPNGPSKWKDFAPECGGLRQSPISITSKDMTVANVYRKLEWVDFDRKPSAMELVNNGHSIQLTATYFGARRPRVSHGPLLGDYIFEQLHFHWGSNDRSGSEHLVNGVQYPMEIHLVHYKQEYGSFAEALKHTDGAAVVAYMYDLKSDQNVNPGLARIVSRFSEISKPGPAVSVGTFPLTDLVRPFVDNYATYTGSLTTPPCSQAVTWLLASQPLYVTKDQMKKFRELKGSHGSMTPNFRPTQPLNGRLVYYVPY